MSLASLRSLLFTPGSDEQKLLRALQAGADATIADLEDAVAPARKDEARALVERVLGGSPIRGGADGSRQRSRDPAVRA